MYMKRLTVIVSVNMVISLLWFCCMPRTDVNTSHMAFPRKDWEERTPESQGVDTKILKSALDYLESESGFDGIRETVVIRNGYMIWKGSNIDSMHNVASITKAFTSTCLGILIDDGKCSLGDLAKDYESRLDGEYPEYGKITLRHFATMTSGYDAESGRYRDDPSDGSKTPFIPTKPAFPPGTKYSYWDDAMCMFGLVLTKVVGTTLYDLFKERVADPIGMNPDKWHWEDWGEVDGLTVNRSEGGIHITARELARFGHLILNRGNWNGTQLISKNWIDEATIVQVPRTMEGRVDSPRQKRLSKGGIGTYGYHWFANGIMPDGSRLFPDAPPGTFYRSGWPQQRLFIIPEWNMVIVRIGRDMNRADRPVNPRACWNTVLKMVGESIVDTPTITGEHKVWQTITISFRGPQSSESDNNPNPFLDYRLQVTFTGPSGQVYNVPGFFDGDGNGGSSGDVWRVRFTPDEAGTWSYISSFRRGSEVAVDLDEDFGSSVGYFDGKGGIFTVSDRDPSAPGFLKLGRLEYTGAPYLKFRDGLFWIKGGVDSPENFLCYAEFDNTVAGKEGIHHYANHVQHWKLRDPTWDGEKGKGLGKGIIGSLNYLALNHVNSIYFMPMNIGGDGQDTWPYCGDVNPSGSSNNDNLHFDISKLRQWEIVFSHAQKKGINLQFVLNEGEEANKKEFDEGTLGIERKLYYREMIARFGHHNALQWNLCEEYNIKPYSWTTEQVRSFADYIREVDPYKHPVTVHNCYVDGWDPFWGNQQFSLTSLQFYPERGIKSIGTFLPSYGDRTEEMRIRARENGRVIPICFDEFNRTSIVDDMQHVTEKWPFLSGQSFQRKSVLWPIYFSGGAGLEYIVETMLSTEDFSKYKNTWRYTWYARKFMEEHLPFWEMEPRDHLLTGETTGFFEDGQVFAKDGFVYAIYLPNARLSGTLNLRGVNGKFTRRWYNPRNGTFEDSTVTVSGGGLLPLGSPPKEPAEDWVVLLTRQE